MSDDPESRLQEVLRHLDGVKKSGAGFIARCPAHDDSTPSLSVRIGDDTSKILLKCRAGCELQKVLDAAGLTKALVMGPRDTPRNGSSNKGPFSLEQIKSWSGVQAVYEYCDEQGQMARLVMRRVDELGKKKFLQFRLDTPGLWRPGTQGARRLLFRLPQLLAGVQRGERIYIPEGEKDVLNLVNLGLVATCNAEGAGKWRAEYAPPLRGAHVVVLPDNDDPGSQHAEMVAHMLFGTAASVRILRLPNLREKGDVSDWISAGGTREELEGLADQAPLWRPSDESRLKIHNTDMGNALRLVERHGVDVRYCPPWKCWLIWDTKRWKLDTTLEINRRAKDTVSAMYQDAGRADGSFDKDLSAWAIKSQSAGRLEAMVKTASSELPVVVEPAALDVNRYALNVANGILDLRTCTLVPHDRGALHTKLVDVPFDPYAKCPAWEATVLRAMDGRVHLAEYLQRFFGYCLTGDCKEQMMLVAYGEGQNGKGTIFNTFRRLLGDYATQANYDTFVAKKNGSGVRDDIADLKGARMVCASEGEQGVRLAEALVKTLTGQDPIKARHLYQALFEFEPEFKLVLYSNYKPEIRGTDYGIWRRIRLVPFEVTIQPEERDNNLDKKLLGEFPGILAWAVRGCREWQKTGLADPPEVLHATDEYRDEMDKLSTFIEDCCELGDELWGSSAALYAAYANWADRNNERVLSSINFGRQLRKRQLTDERQVHHGTQVRGWHGIRLRAELRASSQYEQPPNNLFDRVGKPPKYEEANLC